MATWTGTLPSILAGDVPSGDDWKTILDALHALTDNLTSYTPVWSSSGTQPAIVNGSISGTYRQANKHVYATGNISIGSGTTFGTGSYRVSVPVACANPNLYVGTLWINDSGTASRIGTSLWITTTTLWLTAASGGDVTPTNPQTFASGDFIGWAVLYESA